MTSPPSASTPAPSSPEPPPQPRRPRGIVTLLRENPQFRLLWLAGLISQIGSLISWMVIRIAVTDFARASLTVLGTLELMGLIAQVGSRFFFAPWLDRADRRRLMVNLNIVLGAVALLGLLALHLRSVPLFAVKNTVAVALTAVYAPLTAAVIPQIVERPDLMAANLLQRITFLSAMVLGPTLAGFLTVRFGRQAAFVVDAATFLAAALITGRLVGVFRPKKRGRIGSFKGLLVENLEGFRSVFSAPSLRYSFPLILAPFVTLGMLSTLVFPLLTKIFHAGDAQIGLARAIESTGMIVGVLLFGRARKDLPLATLLPATLMVGCACNLARAFSPNWVSYAMAGIFPWIFLTPLSAAYLTVIQKEVPGEVLGRSMASVQIAQILASSLGAAATPFIGRHFNDMRRIHIPFGALVGTAGTIAIIFRRAIFGIPSR